MTTYTVSSNYQCSHIINLTTHSLMALSRYSASVNYNVSRPSTLAATDHPNNAINFERNIYSKIPNLIAFWFWLGRHSYSSWIANTNGGSQKHTYTHTSLVPRPHPQGGKRGLVNLDHFLDLAGSVCAHRHCGNETNHGSDWSWARPHVGPTIQIYTAGNGALHSCSWWVIWLHVC